MNLWVAREPGTRAEAATMSSVANWNISTKNSVPINGQVQDSIVGSYELTRSSVRLDKFHAMGLFATAGVVPRFDAKAPDALYTGREIASMLFAELAASSRDAGSSVRARLRSLNERFGFAAEDTVSITLEGREGVERIAGVMTRMRADKDGDLGGVPVLAIDDYLTLTRTVCAEKTVPIEGFTPSDVLRYRLSGDDWFCVRPSGTEPKIKIYFGCYGPVEAECRVRLTALKETVVGLIRDRLAQ